MWILNSLFYFAYFFPVYSVIMYADMNWQWQYIVIFITNKVTSYLNTPSRFHESRWCCNCIESVRAQRELYSRGNNTSNQKVHGKIHGTDYSHGLPQTYYVSKSTYLCCIRLSKLHRLWKYSVLWCMLWFLIRRTWCLQTLFGKLFSVHVILEGERGHEFGHKVCLYGVCCHLCCDDCTW